MKRRKTPPERKAADYANEYRYDAWHAVHADRHNRPLAKALEQRLRRRKIRQQLPSGTSSTVLLADAAVDLTAAATPTIEPELRYCSTAFPLSKHLADGRRRRAQAATRRFFTQRYRPKLHRDPFRRFLEETLTGSNAELAEIFAILLGVLHRPPLVPILREHQAADAAWLRAFLGQDPQLEEQLLGWIRRTLRL